MAQPRAKSQSKKRMPTGRIKVGADRIDDRFGVAFIAAKLGIPERTTHTVLTQAGLKDGEVGVAFGDAAHAVVQHYRTQAEGLDNAMQSDKAAKMKAERISAEVDAAKKQGELLMKSDVEAIWADAWARMRVFIELFPALDRESRRELVNGLLEIGINAPGLREVTGDAP
jgi:hypothetical protein